MTTPTGPGRDDFTHRRSVSRRALLIGGVATVVVGSAAGITYVVKSLDHRDPLKVPELLATKGFTIAHRGGSADWPEMSAYAYRQSADHGANGLEISLARTNDGVWFGLHDETLDRVTGQQGLTASELSWKRVQEYSISPAGTTDPSQPRRPFLRLEDLIDGYGQDYTIFIDPKVVDSAYYPELLAILERSSRPKNTFIAKGFATAKAWPKIAREHGLKTWGYYYGRDIVSGKTPLAATMSQWDVLGLDVEATDAVWADFVATGKPVMAHLVSTRQEASTSLARGAQGLMVSDVIAVLG